MVASLFQILIGFSGLMGYMLRFIGPAFYCTNHRISWFVTIRCCHRICTETMVDYFGVCHKFIFRFMKKEL